ncbi:hypothetical protein AVEN_12479-1 [Araneus ventricosus]|uniref:Uncharacterized protein n=1 Tax=Araneus ventricosus TaxID=182803 RepID=A0A4Y2XAX2_ARAVE|nr:hypothetical protein AVEN_12479-1 [Araneus ventricosus]
MEATYQFLCPAIISLDSLQDHPRDRAFHLVEQSRDSVGTQGAHADSQATKFSPILSSFLRRPSRPNIQRSFRGVNCTRYFPCLHPGWQQWPRQHSLSGYMKPT